MYSSLFLDLFRVCQNLILQQVIMVDPLLNVSVGLSLTLVVIFTLLSVITIWLVAKVWPEDTVRLLIISIL
jgi:hypothetical protein